MVSVTLYPCIYVLLCYWVFVLCVACLTVFELFGETIRNILGCVCYFVVECDGSVLRFIETSK